MNAEILTIGDEILIGQIVNTNATWLSQNLTRLGVDVKWVSCVGDHRDDLMKALDLALSRAEIVISTGGLGPTHDDISKKVICEYFNTRLVMNEAVLANVDQIFSSLGRQLDERNREQALVPEIAQALNNRVGTAPGLLIEQYHRRLFVLPGVPMEMQAIFEDQIEPIIKQLNKDNFIQIVTIKTTGLFESQLFEMVQDIVEALEHQVKIAFLPSFSGVNVRLSVMGNNQATCMQQLAQARERFEKRLGPHIYGYDEDLIESIVARLLIEYRQTLALADGFTGGILTSKLFELAEVSQFFKGSYIVPPPEINTNANWYDNTNAFEDYLLGLAEKVKQDFHADWGLSILPAPKPEKNVLRIYWGLVTPHIRKVTTWQYRRARSDNKLRIAQFAMNILREQLQNLPR